MNFSRKIANQPVAASRGRRREPDRQRGARRIAVGVLTLCGLCGPVATSAAAAELEIHAKLGDGVVKEIEIDLDTDDAGTGEFWLHRTGDDLLQGVKLGTDFDQHASVAFAVAAQETDGTFAAPEWTKLTVTASNVTRPGKFTGPVYALQKGKEPINLGTLTVKRAGNLTIAGVGVDAAKIAGAIDAEAFKRHYTVVSNDPEPRKATLVVTQLIGPDGNPTTTTINSNEKNYSVTGSQDIPIDIQPFGRVAIELSVDLPVTGEYAGAVELRTADGRSLFSRIVHITRSGDGTASFSILALSNKEVDDLGFWWQKTSATLDVSIVEDNKSAVTVDNIQVMSLDLVRGKSKTMAVRGDTVVKLKGIDKKTDRITVARNKSEDAEVTVEGLTSPGQYNGLLRMSAGNSKAVNTTFTVFVRRNLCIALLTITAGVIVATILRYLGTKRQQLALRERLTALRQRLQQIAATNGPLNDRLQARLDSVSNAVLRRIDHLEAIIRRDPATDIESKLVEIAKKIEDPLPRWLELAKRAAKWGLLGEVETDLLGVQKFLVQWDSDTAGFADAKAKLDTVSTTLGARDPEFLKAQIAAQIQAVEAQREDLPDAGAVEKILAALRKAEDEVESDAATARATFDNAWRKWLGLFVAQVAAGLPADADLPLGFSDEVAWAAIRNKALSDLTSALQEPDAAAATRRYRTVLAELLGHLIGAFESGLARVIQSIGTPAATDDKKATYLLKLTDIATNVATARGQLTAKLLAPSRAAYDKAVRDFDQATAAYESVTTVRGFAPGASPSPTFVFAPNAVSDAPGFEHGAIPLPDFRAKLGRLRLKAFTAGLLWTVLAIAIIGIMGLEVLYLGNDVWGSLKDFIIAFLWGLGLHSGSAALGTAVNRFAPVPGVPG